MKAIETRKHHYVPQLILRNFAQEKRQTIFAFDKASSREFQVAIADAACERGFYTFDTGEVAGCAEQYLGELETEAGPVLGKIIAARKLPKLHKREKAAIARFATAQLLRSKQARSMVTQMGDLIRRLVETEGTPELKAWVGPPDLEVDKQITLDDLRERVDRYHLTFLAKDWVLFGTDQSRLLIGDVGMVRSNSLNRSDHFGTLGLVSQGVEMYLPLSPTLALAFMCPSISELNRVSIVTLGRKASDFAFDYLLALQDGRLLSLNNENVTHLNSLQVLTSERFLYSGYPDFSLVRQMLDENGELRNGPTLKSNLEVSGSLLTLHA